MILLVFWTIVLIFILKWTADEIKFRKTHKLLPGPISVPFVSSLLQGAWITLGGWDEPHIKRIFRLCKVYGNPMMLNGVVYSFLLAGTYESVKEVLTNIDCQEARFPSDPRFKEQNMYTDLGILVNVGESWREVRKFVVQTLKGFGFGELRTSEQFLEEEVSHLLIEVERMRKEKKNVVHNNYFRLPSLNILWRAMAGGRFTFHDKFFDLLMECAHEISKLNIGIDYEWHFPILRFVPGFAHSRSKKIYFLRAFDYFQGLIAERREKGDYKLCQSNFIDLFLQKIDEENENGNSEFFTDDQLLVTCNDLLLTGIDTTGNALEWSMLYMVTFPEVQEKVHKVIDEILVDRPPAMSDRSEMPYLEALLLEILRFANVVPIMARTTTCDTEISGCFVPKNTLCATLFQVVHEDSKIWGDPENFRPERFLDENMEIINDKYIFAFGAGKRSCVGYTMAKAMWFMFFTSILQRYNLSPCPDRPMPSLKPEVGGIINSPIAHHYVMTLRKIPKSNIQTEW